MGQVSDTRCESGPDVGYLVFDARGNGNGKVCCSIVGGHQISISDYTAIVVEIHGKDIHGEEILLLDRR